jgi:hypothetical protein
MARNIRARHREIEADVTTLPAPRCDIDAGQA